MSNKIGAGTKSEDYFPNQLLFSGKQSQKCTVLRQMTKMLPNIEENLEKISVFGVGTRLNMSNKPTYL